MFTPEDVFHRAKVVVLGRNPRTDLFPNSDPIGKKVQIGNDEFTVIGTFQPRRTLFGSLTDNFVMVPYTTYLSNLWKEFDQRLIQASLRPGEGVEQAKDEVVRVMREQRKLNASAEDDFAITTTTAVLDLFDRITAPVAGILITMSSIALIVGGIGVMNMMLVSVTERTGEIGIRKAVGATRRDILWQFLIEAGLLTGLGGVAGIAMGLVGAIAVTAGTGLPSEQSPFHMILGVVFSVAIGMFFGLYPANRAAKLDPVNAMGFPK
jgi:putative ABC transport system permease protein